MGKPSTQTVTQQTEIDPIKKSYLFGTPLPNDFRQAMNARNYNMFGVGSPPPAAGGIGAMGRYEVPRDSGSEERRQEAAMMDAMYGPVQGPPAPPSSGGGGGLLGGYSGLGDMFDGGGPGQSGDRFEGGGRMSDMANAAMGRGPEANSKMARGGIVALAGGGMVPMMDGTMPNLSDQDTAYRMALLAMRPRGYAVGGRIQGPGTPTSDSIPATIMQDGVPVDQALLSTEEVVLSHKDLANMDPQGDYRRASQAIGNAPNGERGRKAAEMFAMAERFRLGGRVG